MKKPAEETDFSEILSLLAEENKIHVTHSLADGDAIASIFILSRVFGGRCFVPDAISATGKKVCRYLDFFPEILRPMDIEQAGRVFLADVSSPSRTGPLGTSIEEPVIIDHHSLKNGFNTPHYYCFPDRCSTTEILHDILVYGGLETDISVQKAVLLGIITDTGHFRFADSRTFGVTSEILGSMGGTLEELLDALESTENPGKDIAKLKAVQRMRYKRTGDFIIAQSYVSCFESAACKAILDAGAHAAIVASGEKDEFRLTARAKERLILGGLDLGEMFHSLSEVLRGEGGGHAGASSFSGKGNFRKALSIAFTRLADAVGRIQG